MINGGIHTSVELTYWLKTQIKLPPSLRLEFFDRMDNLCDRSGTPMSPLLHDACVWLFGLDLVRVIEGFDDFEAPRLSGEMERRIAQVVPSALVLEFIRLFSLVCDTPPPVDPDLIYYITTESASVQFSGFVYFILIAQSGTVDWGDGNTEFFDSGAGITVALNHTYEVAADYDIKLYFSSPENFTTFTDLTAVGVGYDILMSNTLTASELSVLVDDASGFTEIPSTFPDNRMQTINLGKCTLDSIDLTPYLNLQNAGFSNSSSITTINASGLASLIQLYAFNNALLTETIITGCSSLVDYNVTQCLLDSNEVDDVLIELANLGALNGAFDSSFQIIPAPPTGASLVARNTLTANGWTILTDV